MIFAPDQPAAARADSPPRIAAVAPWMGNARTPAWRVMDGTTCEPE